MCKTIRCAKNNKMCKKTIRCAKKTVYWDLINSNVNKRDVQTGCSGYIHKAAIFENMRIFTVNNKSCKCL